MAPFSNTKSIAMFVIFFLAIASSEASRGINPAAAAPAAATVINIDDLFSSVILGQGQHAPLRDYNPYGDPNRTMNITVECLLSIMDFMSCLEYFIDERMSTPPASCCNGFQSLVYSPPCYCQFVNAGWDREYPQYIPHVLDAATKCGIKRATRTTPWLGCDAYMPPPPSSPSPALAPAADTPAPSSPNPALVPSTASPVPSAPVPAA